MQRRIDEYIFRGRGMMTHSGEFSLSKCRLCLDCFRCVVWEESLQCKNHMIQSMIPCSFVPVFSRKSSPVLLPAPLRCSNSKRLRRVMPSYVEDVDVAATHSGRTQGHVNHSWSTDCWTRSCPRAHVVDVSNISVWSGKGAVQPVDLQKACDLL